MPGILPGPILLRRWGSAAYVEFLSSYSRHVNWETQNLLWEQAYPEGSDSDFEAWKSSKFLTHTWAHVATSMTKTHSVEVADSKILRFQTIWSSYFYLEQPILLPLLYHECAHQYMDESVFPNSINRLFFERKKETAQILSQTACFNSSDVRFWEHLVDEIWADTIAVFLGGRGYLSALFLQLTGLSGKGAFSRFDYSKDEQIPLDDIGTYQREVHEIAWPDLSIEYFWEARLDLAILAYQKFHKPDNDDLWLAGITDLQIAWRTSGAQVFRKECTSSEHETFWNYRARLNKWVKGTCEAALKDCYGSLSKVKEPKQISQIYSLSPKLVSLIQKAVTLYKTNVLGDSSTDTETIAPTRLEDICLETRWNISNTIVQDILAKLKISNGGANGFLDKYTKMYAGYMRNDGSAAFRLAYEWVQARADLYEAAAETLEEGPDCTPVATTFGTSTIKQLHDAVIKDFDQYCIDFPYQIESPEKHRKALWRLITLKKHGNAEQFKSKSNFKVPNLNGAIEQIMDNAAVYFNDYTLRDTQIRVGTLTLGVIRSAEIKGNDAAPLLKALQRTRDYYVATKNMLADIVTSEWKNSHRFKQSFFPLIGDYSFLHYFHNKTPVERDCHVPNTPKFLIKPRLVLQVYGEQEGIPEPKTHHVIGRVVQIRFLYRWEWISLVERLKEYAECSPALFLSSGWEDAILVMWHTDEKDWVKVSEALRLEHGPGLDTHTSVILPSSFVPDSIKENISDQKNSRKCSSNLQKTRDFLNSHPNVKYLNQRTGRYDLTVVWCSKGGGPIKIRDFWEMYSKLPASFWSSIGSVSTSVEKRLKSPDFPNRLLFRVDQIEGARRAPAKRSLRTRIGLKLIRQQGDSFHEAMLAEGITAIPGRILPKKRAIFTHFKLKRDVKTNSEQSMEIVSHILLKH